MMKWVFFILVTSSIIFAAITGDVAAVSQAALSESTAAVTLAISLAGVICLWSGVMRVAQKAGITQILAKIFSPILTRLFKGAGKKSMEYIVLNLTANVLGLGNASTPFGIAAMKELEKEELEKAEFEKGENVKGEASDNMILFVVMNTASLQIIPATVAALRLKNGSANPMEILPAVWIVSSITLIFTITVTKVLSSLSKFSKTGKNS